jgi:hypothetical protein
MIEQITFLDSYDYEQRLDNTYKFTINGSKTINSLRKILHDMYVKMSKDEILQHAYEYAIKEKILNILEFDKSNLLELLILDYKATDITGTNIINYNDCITVYAFIFYMICNRTECILREIYDECISSQIDLFSTEDMINYIPLLYIENCSLYYYEYIECPKTICEEGMDYVNYSELAVQDLAKEIRLNKTITHSDMLYYYYCKILNKEKSL